MSPRPQHAPRSLYIDVCQDVHTERQDIHPQGGIESTENLKIELHRGKFTSIYCFNVFSIVFRIALR